VVDGCICTLPVIDSEWSLADMRGVGGLNPGWHSFWGMKRFKGKRSRGKVVAGIEV